VVVARKTCCQPQGHSMDRPSRHAGTTYPSPFWAHRDTHSALLSMLPHWDPGVSISHALTKLDSASYRSAVNRSCEPSPPCPRVTIASRKRSIPSRARGPWDCEWDLAHDRWVPIADQLALLLKPARKAPPQNRRLPTDIRNRADSSADQAVKNRDREGVSFWGGICSYV
jgi:hypothetical protein